MTDRSRLVQALLGMTNAAAKMPRYDVMPHPLTAEEAIKSQPYQIPTQPYPAGPMLIPEQETQEEMLRRMIMQGFPRSA